MTPTQEHLLKLLIEFDDICRRHDIDYFLEAGTCLGAVRHKGFIPWDNDLDVAMTEPNYDKFVKVCQEELDGVTRTFADGRTNREWPTSFGHYIDLTTCRMSAFSVYWDNLCGQSIDVFCYVELPGDLQENARISNLYYAYDEYLNRSFTHYQRKTDTIYELYHQLLEREKVEGREAVLRDVESQIFGHSYPDSTMLMCNSARMHWTTFMPKKPFDSYVDVDFEGHKAMVPGDWYEFMVNYFGDSFGEYPKDREEAHNEMSHAQIPAKTYVDDLMTAVDKDAALSARLAHKEATIESGYSETKTAEQFFRAQGSIEKHRLLKRLEANSKTLAQLMEENTLESVAELEELLGSFAEFQLHSRTLHWHIHCGAGDEVDEALVYLLMTKGSSHKIDIYMGMRIHNGLPTTDKMVELRNCALGFREARKLWHYGEIEKGRQCFEQARSEMPPTRQVEVWDLLFRYAEAAGKEALELVCQRADELLACDAECDRSAMIKALCLKDLGDVPESAAIFKRLQEASSNGFILNEIESILARPEYSSKEEEAF